MSLELIRDSLLAYYKFDTGSGVEFDSFNGFHTTNINSVGQAAGQIGQAANIVRASLHELNAGSGIFAFDGSEDFAILVWAALNDNTSAGVNNQSPIVSHWLNPSDRGFILNYDEFGDEYQFGVSTNGSDFVAAGGGTFISTAFAMIYADYDSTTGTIRCSVNDGTKGSNTPGTTINQSTQPFRIGSARYASALSDYMDGKVDELLIWQRKLTDPEVTSFYNSGAGVDAAQFLFLPTASGQFGGFLRSQPAAGSQSGQFGGFIRSFTVVSPVNFGGLLLARATNENRNVAGFGGLMQGIGFGQPSGQFGGYMLAQPSTPVPPAFFGGFASGLESQTEQFGGWMFGVPGEDDFAEQHSRTLVKARSQDVVDQDLNLDSELIFFQRSNADFRAKLGIESTSNAQFHGKLSVTRDKITPTSFINVSQFTDASGATEVTVEASGIAGEAGSFFVSAEIDFGEPYDITVGAGGRTLRGGVALPTVSGSISGFEFDQLNPTSDPSGITKVVRASHVYNYPGRYIVTTKFKDNFGMVHMRGFECDLIDDQSIASISGTLPIKGVHYPALEISGVPRQGSVPTSLRVDFPMRASGTGFTALANEVSKLNNRTTSSYDFISWNFGNGFTGTIKEPFTYYDAPGLYIPVLRYQFQHPSGIQTGLDASGIPVYGPGTIWLSESLLIGFNI